jgi:hypothetical protein
LALLRQGDRCIAHWNFLLYFAAKRSLEGNRVVAQEIEEPQARTVLCA